MNRIDQTFERLKAERKKALVTYLCVGDPDADASTELALACADAGADVLELGCPFSDPSADGLAIARASQRALSRGGGFLETLRVAEAVRKRSSVPMVLFGYYNPLFVRGDETAARMAADAGVDAFLVVDLPVDESMPLREAAHRHGLGLIPLVAPTTRRERITEITKVSATYAVPFVYYVSMTGVTGGSGIESVLSSASLEAGRVREETHRPTVVGFGIDSPERAKIAAKDADGIVVGSAIVRRIEEHRTPAERVASVRELVHDLRSVL